MKIKKKSMFQIQREKEKKNGRDLTQSYMYNNNKNIVTTPKRQQNVQ